jgi:uncharacterized protein (TIGR00369 family)
MPHPDLARMDALPLHQLLGIERTRAEQGQSRVEITVSGYSANANQVLHGGILSLLCDVASYAALLSALPDDMVGATHDIHVSAMRPAPLGSRVVFEAQVLRRGRSVAFIHVDVRVKDELIAVAQVTKSLRSG